MGSEERKQAAKVAGAVVASLISHTPAPLMVPIFESALMLGGESRVKGKVRRGFKKRAGSLSPEACEVALALSQDAIKASKFSLGEAAMLGFDAKLSTSAIALHLDGGLTGTEEKHARLAIRVWCDELFRDARKDGSGTFEMIALCLRRLAEIESGIARPARGVDPTTLRSAVTRLSAARVLSDSTRSDPFRGDAAGWCLRSVRWDWNTVASGHLRTLSVLRDRHGFEHDPELAVVESINSSSDALCTWWSLRTEEARVALEALKSWVLSEKASGPENVLLSLDWLISEAKAPRFGFVLPISGSWGSGKSRLLDELAQSGLDHDVVSLQLDVRTSLRGAINDALHSMLGAEASGMELETLCQFGRRVLVMVDDFDVVIAKSPEVFDEFWHLVSAWSALPIRWIVTCDEAGLPPLMQRAGNNFWSQYGPRAAGGAGSDAITGWFALDDHNDYTALGLSILIDSGRGDTAELQQLTAGVSAGYPLRRELNQPVTALLRLRSDLESPLDQVHLNSLMATYWHLLGENLEQTESTDSGALERLVCSIAKASLDLAPFSVTAGTRAADGPQGTSGRVSDPYRLLAILTRRKVVEAVDEAYAPAPEMSSLWGYLLCRELGVTGTAGGEAVPWEDAAVTLRLLQLEGRTEAARALRFLFVWMAQRSYASPTSADFGPWWDAVADPDFPREVIWEAAACLPSAFVVSLVTRTRDFPVADQEVFWMLRLARLTTWSTRDAAVGIEFVARTFDSIDLLGLSNYAALGLFKVIDAFSWTSGSDSSKALTRLGRLSSNRLCWAAADRIVGHLDLRVPARRRTWLTVLREVIVTTEEPEDINSVEVAVVDDELPFWLACIRRFLRQAAKEAGPEVLDELIEAEWFGASFLDSAKSRRVAQLARREIHAAFGRTFQDANAKFIERALQLARGEINGITPEAQALAALYAVRHTTSTGGALVVRVDEQLRDVVEALRQSRNLPPRHRPRLDSIQFDIAP